MRHVVGLAAVVAVAALQASGSRGGEPELISFWGDRSGAPGVWVMRPNGIGRRLVTSSKTNAKRGDFSPDGQWLAFDGASRPTRHLTEFDIHVIRVDGRRRRDLTAGSAVDIEAHWSPDGRSIVFQRRTSEFGPWSIWRTGADGRGLRRLAAGHAPIWTPDGRTITFSRRGRNGVDIYSMRADGTGIRPLLRSSGDDYPASWSNDGRLLFTRIASDAPQADVLVLKASGAVVRLTRGRGLRYAADWSPDGRRVLYTRVIADGHGENGDVFVMDADGGNPKNLSPNRWDENATSWR